jgi:sorting nexin-29
VTEIAGITKIGSGIGFVDDFRNLETEPSESLSVLHKYNAYICICTLSAFWAFIREHLSRHDLQRYSILKGIWTDAGRGRAWLRSTLNEHSLEKYMHMLVESGTAKYGSTSSTFSSFSLILISEGSMRNGLSYGIRKELACCLAWAQV